MTAPADSDLVQGRAHRCTLRLWRRLVLACGALLFTLGAAAPDALAAAAAPTVEVSEVRKIWDAGRHNAFTDLLRWQERWWCVFREGEDHVGGDGAIRVLVSADGASWESAALLTERGIDLRDPKLTVNPRGELMLNCGGSVYEGRTLKGRRSRVLFSRDGRTWSAPQTILAEGEWCWRVTWHEGTAYAAVYKANSTSSGPGPEWVLTLYRATDGVNYEVVKVLDVAGRPNETTLLFADGGEMLALVRREGGDRLGHLGRARPPYTAWTWQQSNHRFGGQNAVAVPGVGWIVGTRDYTHIKPGTSAGYSCIFACLSLC